MPITTLLWYSTNIKCMDLEKLNKHQIILLTLLVSFMTSIATGIVTVSLIGPAPPGVTRTINQIVERTVEKVVPVVSQGAATVTTEKTVVVKEGDLIAQSIASAEKGIIRITARGGELLIARGIIIDNGGTALTDRGTLVSSGFEVFDAILFSGERVPLTIRPAGATTTSIAIVDVAVGTSTGFAPATLADISKLQLGQSIIRIGGKGIDTIGVGVVASLPLRHGEGVSDTIEASISSATPGSVLLTLFGEVIGIATSDSIFLDPNFYSISALATSP